MSELQWEEVERVSDTIEAEILRGLLEAQGIRVWLAQEGAARAIGLSAGPMGEVVVLVPSDQVAEACIILDQYHEGALENDSMDKEYPTNPED
jgi:hypothetical protein